MNKSLLVIFLFLAFKAPAQITPNNGIVYVKKGATGNGSSWANAAGELADALKWAYQNKTANAAAWATTPLQIWVAKGTYKPMYSPEDGVNFGTNKGRDNTFLMVNNVRLYGGFTGAETTIAQRVLTVNGIGNGTILSGDLNDDDIYNSNGRPIGVTNEDNAYHVIVAANNTNAVITEIDGFEIKGGNADGNSFINVKALAVSRYYGGAIYSFSNAIFFNGVSTVNLTNSSLSGNSAFSSASSYASGGAIYSRSTSAASTVSLTNSNLSGNSAFSSASFAYGGGIYSYSNSTSSIVSLINSSVSGNTASSYSFSFGGGIYSSSLNAASTVSLTNSSLSDNTASNGGGICSYANSAALNDVKLVNSTMAANNGVSFILFSNGIKSFKAHNTLVYGNQGSIELTDPNSGSMGSAGAITKDIQYSLVQGEGNTANGNLDGSYTNNILTSLFNDATNRDCSLKVGSPAIGSGDNSLYAGVLATDRDLSGNPRLKGTNIDMGAYENQTITVLPVNFGKFTATLQSNRVKLDWNTFSETNNNSFVIYRSTDGLNYTEIITQASKGSNANSYISFDNSPVNGLNYYRLSQKDNDGTSTKLADAVVNFCLAKAEVKAWPNPVAKTLNVSFTAGKYQSVKLVDITGKKLQERNITSTQSEMQIIMSTYPRGIYVIEVRGNQGNHLLKVIK